MPLNHCIKALIKNALKQERQFAQISESWFEQRDKNDEEWKNFCDLQAKAAKMRQECEASVVALFKQQLGEE